jgi:tripartite-type tricarboxylate transporter receptor subunit TctC
MLLKIGRQALAVAAILAMPLGAASAQSYPTKPVKIVVPFGPGGVADITARIVAQKMSQSMGQQVIVDNKPSAGGIVAAQVVLAGEPDGYSLLLLNNGTAISVSLFKSLPYDTVKDFEPVSAVGFFDVLVLVDKNSPMKTVKDLIDTAKKQPDKMNVGAVNIGSTQELTAELFKSTAGLNFTIVPFKTTPALITALSSGEIQVAFEIVAPVLGFVNDGALRPLAVSADTRYAGLPNVPTVAESGLPNFNVVAWNAVAAKAGTPKPIIDRLNKEILAALGDPDVKQKLQTLGIEARGGTPAEAKQLLVSEIGKWGKVIKEANIPQQ